MAFVNDGHVKRARKARGGKRTFLRIDNDTLDEAKFYRSKARAIAAYADTARELDRFGQVCVASLHFANTRNEIDEYPDLLLSLGPRGGIKCEGT